MRDYQDDYRRASQVFRNIAVDTIADGGGTYQRATGAPVTHSDGYYVGHSDGYYVGHSDGYYVGHSDGYYVGVGNVATFETSSSTTDEIRRAIQAVWSTALPHDAQYVGTRYARGYLYIDYVTHVQNRAIALALAARHGEQAIYDCATGTSVPVV